MLDFVKHRRFKTLLFQATTTVAIAVLVSIPQSSHTAVTSLRSLAENRLILIGAAVAIKPLRNEPIYREILAREFNSLTPEDAMKFRFTQPERDRYDFIDADTIVDFAENNNMKVRGHTLVWHRAVPKWLSEGKFTREELREILRQHIYKVVGHYRKKLIAWDVVNEAINDNNTLRDTIWLRGIGSEYIDLAFRWAHEADPEARLFYNDYNGEGLGKKSDAIYDLVRGMLERGVPIHGVGLQMHVAVNNSPPPAEVAANIERLTALGLDVHITEMDVQIQNATGTETEKFAAQSKIYRDMLKVCLSAPKCKAFVMWGFTDKHSWIPRFTGKPDAALIFDRFYRPKPAYNSLKEQLSNLGGRE